VQNEAPEVPLYATAYLNINDVNEPASSPVKNGAAAAGADVGLTQAKALRTCFTQPGVMPDFMQKVKEKKVLPSTDKQLILTVSCLVHVCSRSRLVNFTLVATSLFTKLFGMQWYMDEQELLLHHFLYSVFPSSNSGAAQNCNVQLFMYSAIG